MEYNKLILGLCVFNLLLTIYLNLQRKEYFLSTPNLRHMLKHNFILLDPQGNIKTLSLEALNNAIEKRAKEWGEWALNGSKNHTNATEVKINKTIEKRGTERDSILRTWVSKKYIPYGQKVSIESEREDCKRDWGCSIYARDGNAEARKSTDWGGTAKNSSFHWKLIKR